MGHLPDDAADPEDLGGEGRAQHERRLGRRRTYNRRREEAEPAPPYFETFSRIADALEGIERLLSQRTVNLSELERERRVRADYPTQ